MADWAAIRAKFRAECQGIVAETPQVETPPTGLFYEGVPCLYGHGTRRYRSSLACVVCARTATHDKAAKKASTGMNETYREAKERYSLLAMYYEQEFDSTGWRRVAVPPHWENV